MAATEAPERPPSEQTVEFKLLDALGELRGELSELRAHPPVWVPAGNWWDELDPNLSGALAQGQWWCGMLPSKPPHNVQLRANAMPDRLELSLMLDGGYIAWQRALFYGRREATHGQRLPC
jgi:hypothetical protein